MIALPSKASIIRGHSRVRDSRARHFSGSAAVSCNVELRTSGETQEEGKAHVDRVELLPGDAGEDAIDATLVYRADLVHERERALAQSAAAGRELRIERPLACRAADRNDGDELETLIRRDFGIADDDARPGAALLVADSRIESDENERPSFELHFPSIQPRPGTQRTDRPARTSTRSEACSSGSLAAQSLNPASASSLVSG